MAEFDINKIQGNDRYIAGGAVALIVLSFFSWYTVSFSAGDSALGDLGSSGSGSLWDAGYGTLKLALLLAVLAGVTVLGRLMGFLDPAKLPVGINVLTLFASGGATLLFLLRLVTSFKSETVLTAEVSGHPAYGWYLGLAVSAAMTYFAYRNVQAAGEAIPGLPGGSTKPPVDPPPTAP